jgi:hypothetical protein
MDEEQPLELLYDAIANNKSLGNIHFWKSDIHYTRAAIHYATGVYLTLKETHRYLVEEGLIKEHDR